MTTDKQNAPALVQRAEQQAGKPPILGVQEAINEQKSANSCQVGGSEIGGSAEGACGSAGTIVGSAAGCSVCGAAVLLRAGVPVGQPEQGAGRLAPEKSHQARYLIDASQPEELANPKRHALYAELLEHARSLERSAADDRETGESIEQAVEDGEGYTPDEAGDVAAGLQHDADRAEETAALLRKAAAALAARQPGAQQPSPTWTSFQTLEVGRAYQLRSGGEIEITAHSGNPNKPFKSSHGSNYRSDGRYYGSDDSCLDLVKVRMGESLAQGIDLHRLVPPEWLSEQIGGPMDDLTPGQAWREGFNQCRARALMLVEQAMGFPSDQQSDAAPGVKS